MAMQNEVFSCQIDHISLMSPLLVLWFIYCNLSVIHPLQPLVICYCVLVTCFGSYFDKIIAEGSENHQLVPRSQIWAFEQQILDMQKISQILCKNSSHLVWGILRQIANFLSPQNCERIIIVSTTSCLKVVSQAHGVHCILIFQKH